MRPKIYLFGDSITEMSYGDGGWGASLADHFSRTVFPKKSESLVSFFFCDLNMLMMFRLMWC